MIILSIHPSNWPWIESAKRLMRISLKKIVTGSSIEATVDNTIDPYIELAVLAAELAVDTSIEAILVAEERGDEFSVDPLIEAIKSRETTDKEAEGPRFKSSQFALRHTIVQRLSEFDEFEFRQRI